MRLRRVFGAKVEGHCLTCPKEFNNPFNRFQAYRHAKKTGHRVTVDITNHCEYN